MCTRTQVRANTTELLSIMFLILMYGNENVWGMMVLAKTNMSNLRHLFRESLIGALFKGCCVIILGVDTLCSHVSETLFIQCLVMWVNTYEQLRTVVWSQQ